MKADSIWHRTPFVYWLSAGFTVVFIASGPYLDRHHRLLGAAFIVWGVLWGLSNRKAAHDDAYLERVARSQLRFRRLDFVKRKLSDEEYMQSSVSGLRRGYGIFSWMGIPVAALGIAILITGR